MEKVVAKYEEAVPELRGTAFHLVRIDFDSVTYLDQGPPTFSPTRGHGETRSKRGKLNAAR